jgi:hypothetical protein
MNLTPDVFEEAKEHGYFNGFSIFDEYPSEELEGVLGNDCVLEIEDEFEDLPQSLMSLQMKTLEVIWKEFPSLMSLQMKSLEMTLKMFPC